MPYLNIDERTKVDVTGKTPEQIEAIIAKYLKAMNVTTPMEERINQSNEITRKYFSKKAIQERNRRYE